MSSAAAVGLVWGAESAAAAPPAKAQHSHAEQEQSSHYRTPHRPDRCRCGHGDADAELIGEVAALELAGARAVAAHPVGAVGRLAVRRHRAVRAILGGTGRVAVGAVAAVDSLQLRLCTRRGGHDETAGCELIVDATSADDVRRTLVRVASAEHAAVTALPVAGGARLRGGAAVRDAHAAVGVAVP